MQRIEWLGMRMQVPDEWEIVRHSVSPQKGRLVFVDRREQRLQVSWLAAASRPDLERATSDYRSRDLEEDPGTRFEELARGRWKGFRRLRGRTVLTRAGMYHEPSKRWLELVIFWPDGVDPEAERALLETFEAQESRGAVRLSAFGIDLRAPEGWALEGTEVKPAAVTILLSRPGAKMAVKRLGMVESWLKGDLEGFLRGQMRGRDFECSPARRNGHAAQRAEGRQAGSKLSRLLGLTHPRADMAWVCPTSHALFQVTVEGRGVGMAEAEAVKVNCCGTGGEGNR
jgi:hypothetical protein